MATVKIQGAGGSSAVLGGVFILQSRPSNRNTKKHEATYQRPVTEVKQKPQSPNSLLADSDVREQPAQPSNGCIYQIEFMCEALARITAPQCEKTKEKSNYHADRDSNDVLHNAGTEQ